MKRIEGEGGGQVELRWNAKGEGSWCIIHGARIIGFGPGDAAKDSCYGVLGRKGNLDSYRDWPDYTFLVNQKVGESGLGDEQFVRQSQPTAWEDRVYRIWSHKPDTLHGTPTFLGDSWAPSLPIGIYSVLGYDGEIQAASRAAVPVEPLTQDAWITKTAAAE